MVLSNSFVRRVFMIAVSLCFVECDDKIPCHETDIFGEYLVKVKPTVDGVCAPCHQNNASDMRLYPGDDEHNIAELSKRVSTKINGISLPLVKMIGGDDHGGKNPVEEGSEIYQNFADWFLLVEKGDTKISTKCPLNTKDFWDSVILLDAPRTLDRAFRDIAGVSPPEELVISVKQGDATGLEKALLVMLEEDGAREWFMTIHDREIHTDKYKKNGVDVLSGINYPDKYFWQAEGYTEEDQAFWKHCAHETVGREPLITIAEIIGSNRPYTDILTTSVAVNPCSAQVYGIPLDLFENATDPREFIFLNPPEMPVGGGPLASNIASIRKSSTPTNRNRARAEQWWRFTLGIRVLERGDRPVDPNAIFTFNPVMQDPACTVCHTDVDPVAGLFQNYADMGYYHVPDSWHADIFAPGIGIELPLPYAERTRALSWAGEMVRDTPTLLEQFRKNAVRRFFTAITGQEILVRPTNIGEAGYQGRLQEAEIQEVFLDGLIELMIKRKDNIKDVVVAILMSPYYRAVNATEILSQKKAERFTHLGNPCVRTPQELNRWVESMVLSWGDEKGAYLTRTDKFLVYRGGADSDTILEPLCEPNGFGVLVEDLMARQIACATVANDFARPKEARSWFPLVEMDDIPTYKGETISGILERIEDNVRFMHQKMFREELPEEELTGYIGLLITARQSCLDEIALGTWSSQIPGPCQAIHDPETGEDLAIKITEDPQCTNVMWRILLEAMLTDPRFTLQLMHTSEEALQ